MTKDVDVMLDAYTSEFTQSRHGKVALVGKRVVSRDGEDNDPTATAATAKDEAIDHMIVLDRT